MWMCPVVYKANNLVVNTNNNKQINLITGRGIHLFSTKIPLTQILIPDMDNTDQYPMYMCLIGISDIQHIRYLSDTSDRSKSSITSYIRSLYTSL